jgi:arylsulfatase
MVRWPGKVAPGRVNSDILGGFDLMATFAALAGADLPKIDREGLPIVFDSYDMTPVWTGSGESARKSWFYFNENELSPGAVRVHCGQTSAEVCFRVGRVGACEEPLEHDSHVTYGMTVS